MQIVLSITLLDYLSLQRLDLTNHLGKDYDNQWHLQEPLNTSS